MARVLKRQLHRAGHFHETQSKIRKQATIQDRKLANIMDHATYVSDDSRCVLAPADKSMDSSASGDCEVGTPRTMGAVPEMDTTDSGESTHKDDNGSSPTLEHGSSDQSAPDGHAGVRKTGGASVANIDAPLSSPADSAGVYHQWTVAQLQAKLKRHGLNASGSKSTLLANWQACVARDAGLSNEMFLQCEDLVAKIVKSCDVETFTIANLQDELEKQLAFAPGDRLLEGLVEGAVIHGKACQRRPANKSELTSKDTGKDFPPLVTAMQRAELVAEFPRMKWHYERMGDSEARKSSVEKVVDILKKKCKKTSARKAPKKHRREHWTRLVRVASWKLLCLSGKSALTRCKGFTMQ